MDSLDKNLILFIDSCFEEELYQSGLEILDVVFIPNNENYGPMPFLPERYLLILINLIIQRDNTNQISQKAAQLLYRIVYSKKFSKNELYDQWSWMFCHQVRARKFRKLIDTTNIDDLNLQSNLQLNSIESIFSKFSNVWRLIQYCFEEPSTTLYILLNCIVSILELDYQEYSKESEKELEKMLFISSLKNNDREKPNIKQVLAAIFANIDLENYEYPLSFSSIMETSIKGNVIKSIESMMLRKRLLYLTYNVIYSLPKNINKFDFENELSIYLKKLEINKFIFYLSNVIPSPLKSNLCHMLLVKYSVHSKLSRHFLELSIDMLKLWPSIASHVKLGLSEKAKYSFLLQMLLKNIFNDILLKKITQEEQQAMYLAKMKRIAGFNDEFEKIKQKNKITSKYLHIKDVFEQSEYIISFILKQIS
ncbi:hypothetical protein PNEG_00075 [Pneumocystis murina B123]|uniref:Uncharacterized protein n=1 Tax=Pneumocystis murina (strain B123) TaxID=1069680 RepID=M7NWG2_PNEMU|nr:hypothetical protein PNEG_00075 [Pneumocystis murina B123]EMR11637.1 hypothetical protein PNEG_00075 [Pneumocystis murina B123]